MVKTKEQLINELEELNNEFISKIGKASVVEIAIKMCKIEDELWNKYQYRIDDELEEE